MKRWLRRWWPIGLVTLGALLVIGAYGTYRWELRPVNKALPDPIAVSITPGERSSTIAQQLQSAKIIRSRWAFQVYVTIHGLRRKIEAGYYELSPADSTITNAKIIARGIVVNKAFLVPEGATIQQIEDNAAQNWLRGNQLPAAMADSYPNAFLAQRPAGASLEGYLFPDTYEISPSTTPHQLVQAMLNNFGMKVTPDIVAGFAKEGLTLHQGITLASIVERETKNASDRPIVAQVFLSRFKLGMPLGSDVTALYGAQQAGVDTTNPDVAINVDSPYNTRIHTGLPPGPIANPGLASIKAVVNPANTNYLYFVADANGNILYAQTLAQHQANCKSIGLSC